MSTGSPAGALIVNRTLAYYWNSTYMDANHSYAVEFVFGASLSVTASAGPQPWGASISMALRMSGPKHGINLHSVVLR